MRNGTRTKTVLTEAAGHVDIEVPRDRAGTFEPQIVRKRQRRLSGVDEIVLSLYAKGLTTGEISAHFAEIYGASVSKETVSRITDRVLEEMNDWTVRPLDEIAAELAAGRVPSAVPVMGGDAVSESEIIEVIESAGKYGLPQKLASQVVAAVRSGDERDALITASAGFVRSHLQTVLAGLEQGNGVRVDVVDALGRQAGQPQHELIEQMNSLRRVAGWFPRWLSWLTLLGAALGIAATAVGVRRPRRALAVLAVSFGGAGLVVWVGARVIGRLLHSPLDLAATPGRGNVLPPSVVAVRGDLNRSIGEDLMAAVDRRAIGVMTIAVLFAISSGSAVVYAWARRTDWRAVAAVAVAVAVAALLALVVPAIAAARSTPDPRGCNGHPELCDRPYNDVVQVATHNSMSSPDVVQIWPEHDGNIQAQLDFGVRTLMIDTHYRTAIDTPAELSSIEQSVPADIASYLYSTLDKRLAASPGVYLCHSRCAHGAIAFGSTLSTIRGFLDANPDEVVTLIIQNGVSTDDTTAAFEVGGLASYLYDGELAGDWPTLRELIDSGKRLMVFAEAAGPPPDWYHAYADLVQDTEYHVDSVDDLSCASKRGRLDAPLFVLNNWIRREAPDRADAAIVNQRNFIVDRARRCETERGQIPNFIAVDFFGIGDVIEAVAELNGLRG